MEITVDSTLIVLKKGDITKEDTGAIVNAANSRLAGGGGVDGAIHRAGGPEIISECRKIGVCPTGEAVITTGGNLPAAHVIHTVGPIYRNGRSREEDSLRSTYFNSLTLALDNGLTSISFPSISTGVYGYPIKEAARTALSTTIDFIKNNSGLTEIRFILFSEDDLNIYTATLKSLAGK